MTGGPARLTAEQQDLARGAIEAWFDDEIASAERALTQAGEALQKMRTQREAWTQGEPLTPIQATVVEAAAGCAYQEEAYRFLSGKTPSRERVDELRTTHQILGQYLRETYGHDTTGGRPA